jgi:tRNA threonylcarbamoyl adenosine modification protein YeaZ
MAGLPGGTGVILAIDTSATVAVATVHHGQVLAELSDFNPRGHAELLSPMIEQVLAGARPDAVVVGTGPAPFTGLRVGLVTARTLATVWGVPLYGMCSLDAVGAEHGGDCTVVADARRKEVYWATYAGGRRVEGPAVSSPGDVVVHGQAVGRGALLYPEAFPGAAEADPRPSWLARELEARLAAGQTDFPTDPLYLRRPDVHGVPGG